MFSTSPRQLLAALTSSSSSGVVCVYQQEEELEAQVSFLQGQINDLEAMSKYCAKMMNSHICECQTKTDLLTQVVLIIHEVSDSMTP